MSDKVIAVLGAGPGLGMSMAHRFGREGFDVAVVSRSGQRHDDYRASLAEAGIKSRSYVADVTDHEQQKNVIEQVTAELGEIDTLYFGPASADAGSAIIPITEAGAESLRLTFEAVVTPAANVVTTALPAMRERGSGAMFFGGGLSGKYPLPRLGNLGPASAALRMYVLALNAELAGSGIYVASLTIGGLIERGDIHRMFKDKATAAGAKTLNPDSIADTAWRMYVERDAAESEFNALSDQTRRDK